MSSKTKRLVTGILWMFSGVFVLILALLLNILLRNVLSDPGTPENEVALVSNLISWVVGSAGVVLLFIGPFVGYRILTQKD